MMEMLTKINDLSLTISEVLPKKRIKKLAKAILVKPIAKALKSVDVPFGDDDYNDLKKVIYKFIDEITPEDMSNIIAMIIFKNIRLMDELDKISSLDDIKVKIEKVIAKLEKNADILGKFIKNFIIFSIKMSFEKEDDEIEDEEDNDEEKLPYGLICQIFGVPLNKDTHEEKAPNDKSKVVEFNSFLKNMLKEKHHKNDDDNKCITNVPPTPEEDNDVADCANEVETDNAADCTRESEVDDAADCTSEPETDDAADCTSESEVNDATVAEEVKETE